MKLKNGWYEKDKLDKNSTIWSLAINDVLLEYHQNYSSAKKMTANEMFEKLGYEKYGDYEYRQGSYSIIFEYDRKQVIATDGGYDRMPIDMKELQAINQKCKELGWL